MSDNSPPPAAYNDIHRAFLQALLSRQTIEYESAKPLIAAIKTAADPERPTLEGDVTIEEFEELINAVSDALTPFDFEIRSSKGQKNGGELMYALVNSTSDPITQMATMHSADEIAFTKRVLDRMFDTNNTVEAEVMAVTSMEALHLRKAEGRRDSGQTQQEGAGASSNAADISMHQAEAMLASLVAEGWFDLSEDEKSYSLSQRGLMELKQWLEATYNEPEDEEGGEEAEVVHKKIKRCNACQEIITVGQRCPSVECHGRLHDHCTQSKWRIQKGSKHCPVCKTPWQGPLRVGEEAAGDARRARGQNGRRSTNGRSSRGTTNGADSEGSEDLYA